jgi:hypothetical protein
MAHTCNPSYSGGRDQEYHSLQTASGKQFQDSISKKKILRKKRFVQWLKWKKLLPSKCEALVQQKKKKNRKREKTQINKISDVKGEL